MTLEKEKELIEYIRESAIDFFDQLKDAEGNSGPSIYGHIPKNITNIVVSESIKSGYDYLITLTSPFPSKLIGREGVNMKNFSGYLNKNAEKRFELFVEQDDFMTKSN